jgi:succinate-semialdehyde dehydrogenase/glutarate-semialdehyde dehydrogenase
MIFPQQVENLRNASRILINKKEEYAALMATEMGKPVRDGRAEIEKCAWVCDYYADNALTALQSEVIETDAFRSYVSFQPLGVILWPLCLVIILSDRCFVLLLRP